MHQTRLALIEHAYMTDGTLSSESMQYLLWLARLSDQMEKAGQALKEASESYEAELLNVIQSQNSQILALKEQLNDKD